MLRQHLLCSLIYIAACIIIALLILDICIRIITFICKLLCKFIIEPTEEELKEARAFLEANREN